MRQHHNKLQSFLDIICQQVRHKAAHEDIANELIDHVEEQKKEYIRQGMEEEAAIAKAVEQMGDPVLVGQQLNKAHKPKTEWSILIMVGMLTIIGGLVQYLVAGAGVNNQDVFIKYLYYAPLGLLIFFMMYFFDYMYFSRLGLLIYGALIVAGVLGFFGSHIINGAYRHMYYISLLFIPAFAGIVYKFRNKGYIGIVSCGAFYGIAAFMCLLAPSFAGLMLLTASCLVVLTAAIWKGYFGVRRRLGLAVVYVPFLFTTVFFVLIYFEELARRFAVMLNPRLDAYMSGYQQLIVKVLLNSAKPFGRVIIDKQLDAAWLADVPIESMLPNWASNLSLTYIFARFGYVAGFAIVTVMMLLVIRMLASILKQKNSYGLLLGLAAFMAITGQIALNVLSNLGIISPWNVTLPLISYGSLSFLINMGLLGVLLSVYRRSNLANDRFRGSSISKNSFITLHEGKIIIDLNHKSK